jgi:hypothetical protein
MGVRRRGWQGEAWWDMVIDGLGFDLQIKGELHRGEQSDFGDVNVKG